MLYGSVHCCAYASTWIFGKNCPRTRPRSAVVTSTSRFADPMSILLRNACATHSPRDIARAPWSAADGAGSSANAVFSRTETISAATTKHPDSPQDARIRILFQEISSLNPYYESIFIFCNEASTAPRTHSRNDIERDPRSRGRSRGRGRNAGREPLGDRRQGRRCGRHHLQPLQRSR